MVKNIDDISGQRFGKLVALSYAGRSSNRNIKMWNCFCDCGVKKQLSVYDLKRAKSCGCLVNQTRKRNIGNSAFYSAFYNYKKRSISKNLSFELTEQEFFEITQENCHYCGLPPSNVSKRTSGSGNVSYEFIYSGIDRVDNKKGYEAGNIVPCCWTCNFYKGTGKVENFESWLDQIARHRANKAA